MDWAYAVTRKEKQHLTSQVLGWRMEGNSREGRARETWICVASKEFKNVTGLDWKKLVGSVWGYTAQFTQ